MTEYANIGLKRAEITQRTEFMRLSANKLAKEAGLVEEGDRMQVQEAELIAELEALKCVNPVPVFPSFTTIKPLPEQIKG